MEESRLLRDGLPVPLKPKVFETLLVLVENGAHVMTKDELMARLWPDSFVEEANLAVNISQLRKALGDDDNVEQFTARLASSTKLSGQSRAINSSFVIT